MVRLVTSSLFTNDSKISLKAVHQCHFFMTKIWPVVNDILRGILVFPVLTQPAVSAAYQSRLNCDIDVKYVKYLGNGFRHVYVFCITTQDLP